MEFKMHHCIALLILTTLFFAQFGCERVDERRATAVEKDERDNELAELENIKNEYPQKSGANRGNMPKPELRHENGLIKLIDLKLSLRRIRFDKPIDGNLDIYLGETEVTNTMYAAYLSANGRYRDDTSMERIVEKKRSVFSTGSPVIDLGDKSALWRKGELPKNRGDHPVVLVTTPQAMAFCKWLNSRYRHKGEFRLPTEKEWLFAAFGKSRKYPWGDGKKSWTSKSTESVKARSELRSPDGLYGLWGNGAELILSPSDGYGGKIKDIIKPVITKWQGPGLQETSIRGNAVKPRQEYWGYTHSLQSRSHEWGFRVVYIPKKSKHH